MWHVWICSLGDSSSTLEAVKQTHVKYEAYNQSLQEAHL